MTLDERIDRYLVKCPPAVSGSDGHGTTFKVACALVNGFALEPDAAVRWLEVYNKGCMPPWKPRELRHKVEQAAKVNHQKPRGHLLESGRFGRSEESRPIRKCSPKPVPMLSKAPKSNLRTLRTLPSGLRANAGARTRAGIMQDVASEPSGASETAISREEPRSVVPPQVSVDRVQTEVDWPALVLVPGCKVGRPPEVEMTAADWHALEVSGFIHEPMVQFAAWMFGPDCSVVETGRADA